MKKQYLIAFGFLLIAALSCQRGESPELVSEGSGDVTVSTSSDGTYGIGDIVSTRNLNMTVLGWERSNGEGWIVPQEGNVYIGVDAIFKNEGNSTYNLRSGQFRLKDGEGQQYIISLFASGVAGEGLPGEELATGEVVRGQLGFEVPSGTTGLQLVFDPPGGLNDKVIIILGDQPALVDIPPGYDVTSDTPVFSVGDVVSIGDMQFSISNVKFSSGGAYVHPEEGNMYVLMDLTITNTGSEAHSFSSGLQLRMKDGNSQVYDFSLAALIYSQGTVPDGEYLPGETIMGQIGFEVPEDAAGLRLIFDANLWDLGEAEVQIN